MNEVERVRAAYPTLPDQMPPAASVARLQAAYAASAVARVGTRASPRRRHPRPSRRIGLFAIAVVIVSGTAVAATSSGWRPLLGSSDRPRPLPATSTVPADQLAALAVLRRPQTDADRGPLVQAALRKLDRRSVNGIHTDAIRVISRGPREVTVLIPVEHFRHSLSGTQSSTTGERDVLYLMSSSYQHARTWKITAGGKPRTIRFPAGYEWGGSLGTLETLRSTGIQTGTGPVVQGAGSERATTRFVTLVPDGVARVKVRLRGGRSVTVPVKNNVYRYAIRGVYANLGTVWFDAAGHRIDHRKRP